MLLLASQSNDRGLAVAFNSIRCHRLDTQRRDPLAQRRARLDEGREIFDPAARKLVRNDRRHRDLAQRRIRLVPTLAEHVLLIGQDLSDIHRFVSPSPCVPSIAQAVSLPSRKRFSISSAPSQS